MDRNTRDVSGDSEAMLSFFGCSKFSVWVCNTSDVHTGQTFAINWLKIQLSWVLMLYYPYKTMFSAYKPVIGSPCACDLFVSDENHLVHGCPFLAVIFRRFFSHIYILKTLCVKKKMVENSLLPLSWYCTCECIYLVWRFQKEACRYDLVPKGAHARGYALQLKTKHCWKLYLHEWMNI